MENKKRIDGLDLLKLIAIMMIISQHVPLFYCDFVNGDSVIEYLFKLLFEGVPIFYAVNGYLLLKKETLDIKKHYQKTVKTYLLLRIWSFILIVIGMKLRRLSITFESFIIYFYGTGGTNNDYTSHLWFMQNLIAIYLFYPLFWKAYKENYGLFKIIFGVICIFTVGFSLLECITNLINNQNIIFVLSQIRDYLERFSLLNGPRWSLLYFCIGGIIYKNKEKINDKNLMFVLIGFVSWLLSFGYAYIVSIKTKTTYSWFMNQSSMFSLGILLGWFALSNKYQKKGIIGKCIQDIGTNTFGIYVIHLFIMELVRVKVDVTTFGLRILVTILTFMISYCFAFVTRRIPYIKKIVEF